MLQTVTPTMQAQFVDFFLRKTQGSFEVCGTGLGPAQSPLEDLAHSV